MKNHLIGALVASLILFVWQFLSWSLLNLHNPQMQYTPAQDAILEVLATTELSEGQYYIPRLPDGASAAEREAYYQEQVGKPWALISYHSSMKMSMGMNMLRGFVVDFLAAFLLIWVLLKMTKLDMKTALFSSLAIGLIGYLTINYLNTIWFEVSSIADLVDAILQWGLVGLWLGWYLPGKEAA